MLIPDFYTVVNFHADKDQVNARIRLNPGHEVYQGHFPEQPVVPGVIQLQIIKEMLEKGLKKKLLFKKVISAKYYSMIIPGETPEPEISIQFKRTEEGELKITSQINSGEKVFTKVRGVLSLKNKSFIPVF